MRAGPLRHRITIKSKTVTRNAVNEEIITWAPVTTVWAAVATTGGSEYIDTQSEGAALTHQVTIRYWPDLKPTMIVDWDGRLLEIEVVQEDNLQRQTVLLCSEAITD